MADRTKGGPSSRIPGVQSRIPGSSPGGLSRIGRPGGGALRVGIPTPPASGAGRGAPRGTSPGSTSSRTPPSSPGGVGRGLTTPGKTSMAGTPSRTTTVSALRRPTIGVRTEPPTVKPPDPPGPGIRHLDHPPGAKPLDLPVKKDKGAEGGEMQNGYSGDPGTPDGDNPQIYTDWANHYLEKARYKRFIVDLQTDICDGVLLGEVVHAVTNERVRDINNKPRNSSQMIDNIAACLTFLAGIGVNVEGLSARDIKDGNLKAILGLFFSLSRYKQQQKAAQQQQQQQQHNLNQNTVTDSSSVTSPTGVPSNRTVGGVRSATDANSNANPEMLSRLPSAFKGSKGPSSTTSSPRPSKESALATPNNLNKKTPQLGDRGRPRQIQNNNNPPLSISGNSLSTSKSSVSRDSSRSTSPSSGLSSIPTPGGRGRSLSDKAVNRVALGNTSSSVPAKAGRIPTASPSPGSPATGLPGPTTKNNSMLDKFKFFGSKEKDKSKDKSKSSSKSSSKNAGASTSKDCSPTNQAAQSVVDSSQGASARPPEVGAIGGMDDKKASKKSFGLKKEKAPADDRLMSLQNGSGSREASVHLAQRGIPTVKSSASSSSSSSMASSKTKTTSPTGPGKAVPGSRMAAPQSSKIAGVSSKNLKAAKNSTSTSNLSLASSGSGIPTPGTGIPKPGSRSKSKEEKVSRSGSSSKQYDKPVYVSNSKQQLAGSSSRSASAPSSHDSRSAKMNNLNQADGMSDASQQQTVSESSSKRLLAQQQQQQMQMHHQHQMQQHHQQHLDQAQQRHHIQQQQQQHHQQLVQQQQQLQRHHYQQQQIQQQQQQQHQQHQQQQHKSHSSRSQGESHTYIQPITKPTYAQIQQAQAQQQQQQLQQQASQSQAQQPQQKEKKKSVKVDSDTQTAESVMQATRQAKPKALEQTANALSSKENSNHSISSTGQESNSNSTSNSNNSVSSNDSVIFRPSSCEDSELESDHSGMGLKPTDHISQLRQKQHQQLREKSGAASPKMKNVETTFEAKGKGEPKEKSKETVISEENNEEIIDIKPMQPIQRATPYSYLRAVSGGPLPKPSLHISTTLASSQNSASSRLGINRPLLDHTKLYSASSLRRAASNGNTHMEPDYSSDVDFDVTGYMSDGDVLRSSHNDEYNSGYMSEGGASLYARKMQQRFREGMQAVRECMQKGNGIMDDDRYVHTYPFSSRHSVSDSSFSGFDDSSSISSGDISDTIAEISTDEALTGSSLSAGSERNPYVSLQRNNDVPGKTFNLLSKRSNAILDRNLNLHGHESIDNWRKYQIRRGDTDISDTRSDGSLERGGHWPGKERNDLKSYNPYRAIEIPAQGLGKTKLTSGTSAIAIEDVEFSEMPKTKRDSETNTDYSALMMRKQQQQQANRSGIPSQFVRRPVSASSTGSNGSAGSQGERLANYKGNVNMSPGMPQRQTSKSSSGSQTHYADPMGNDYATSTLERKKMGVHSPGSTHTHPDYTSVSLGRKRPDGNLRERLFGSKGSLNIPTSEGTCMVGSTIISNPHATYSKHDGCSQTPRSYVARSGGGTMPLPSQANYVNIQYLTSEYLQGRGVHSPTSPSNWIKSAPPSITGRISDTESMESLVSAASSIQAQIQQARAHSLATRSILQQERENQNQVGLVRSDSFRSTQSEQIYSTTGVDGLYRTSSIGHLSQPSSPGSTSSSRFTYPLTSMSPTNTARACNTPQTSAAAAMAYANFVPLSKISSKDDDAHGSSLSLVSSSSSVYSSVEEKASAEIRKLRRELDHAQEKVLTLTSQLSTNAHVVAAFEQSLSNMTSRLQSLTSTAEQKDSELNELRRTIELLKHQSGIHLQGDVMSPPSARRQSTASDQGRLVRHRSSESMSSINSISSACSATSQQSSATDIDSKRKDKKKNKSWLRSSFSKAFSRKPKNKHGSVSDVEPDTASLMSDASVPNSPLLQPHSLGANGQLRHAHSSTALCDDTDKAVVELQHKLHEKDMKMTDIQLEALSSAHQLEQLRDTMNRMKMEMHALKADNERLSRLTEMASLKADNDRLSRLVNNHGNTTSLHTPVSPTGSTASPSSPGIMSLDKRLSLTEMTSLDLLLGDALMDRDGRRITLSVSLSCSNDLCRINEHRVTQVMIGVISVSGKTKWDILDAVVRKVFKDYIARLDPATKLGLNADTIHCYNLGEIIRQKESHLPELLPCGYLVGETTNITLCLKGTEQNSLDALSFETLIPKSIVQRYVSLLVEHRRIILCGPSGTGKTYLAQRLAEYLVTRSGKEVTAGVIATFNVDHKSSKELRQYLANIADQCESTSVGELPSVIILDNLHHVSSLGEVFNGFLSVKYEKCPYIIGTMNQATCSTTNLQLHHNFRWVLCANHMEPVKGFLGRFLRRKLIEYEVLSGERNNDLTKIVDWMPKVWQHLNKFLETHSSSDVTVGPRLFLACPMDVSGSQVWFTDLWNYSIVPYLLEAVREGLQLYGRRAPWEDPADWVRETYPWPHAMDSEWPSLLRLRPEDVGYDMQGAATTSSNKSSSGQTQQSDAEGDPLLNMLIRLQEAASYSSPQSNDSDSTSMDSHSSTTQEAGEKQQQQQAKAAAAAAAAAAAEAQ